MEMTRMKPQQESLLIKIPTVRGRLIRKEFSLMVASQSYLGFFYLHPNYSLGDNGGCCLPGNLRRRRRMEMVISLKFQGSRGLHSCIKEIQVRWTRLKF
ncbi:hypothetical protein Lser_V15G17251 [Lactuca serriola]